LDRTSTELQSISVTGENQEGENHQPSLSGQRNRHRRTNSAHRGGDVTPAPATQNHSENDKESNKSPRC